MRILSIYENLNKKFCTLDMFNVLINNLYNHQVTVQMNIDQYIRINGFQIIETLNMEKKIKEHFIRRILKSDEHDCLTLK